LDNEFRALTGIVIDPGHGGSDSGALGNNMQEKDYTLLISKYMYDRFKELGIPVTLTRSADETLTPSERVQRILQAYGNNPNVIVISNHLNAGGGTGAEVIYALRNNETLARKILESLGAEGQTMRKYYQRRLPSDTSKDYYFIHRNTGTTEPVIVEYGFIDDKPANAQFLRENYQDLAEAVIRAVVDYKGLTYIPPKGYVSTTYTVKSGDTLYSIAQRLGTTVSELRRLNNLKTDTLTVGQILQIPTEYIQEDESNIYIVEKGDSLYSIANKYNTTISELRKLNNLTTDILTIGQTLLIPSALITPDTYTVSSGDTLYSIANKFNTTVNEIKNLNNLTSNTLSVGEILKIPTPESDNTIDTAISYAVVSGDTLYSIASKYNTTIDAIKQLNNLTSNTLSVGATLLIPTSYEVEEETPNVIRYTVLKGDSLYSIAKKYDVSVDAIKSLNSLTSNLINVGEVLQIPTTSTTDVTYAVQSGDNLYKIARRFNTTIDELKRLNNLTSNILSVGQILILE